MKLTQQDIELFKSLNNSGVGRAIVDYLTRLNAEILDPETLTAENVESRKEAIKQIKTHLVDRIQLVNESVRHVNETE